MEVYEVLCEGVNEARQFRFGSINEAMTEAERICKQYNVAVRVVRVIGSFEPNARWISNGVRGYR